MIIYIHLSLVCVSESGLAFTWFFSEFGKILDLVGQGSGRRSRGPNHYKFSVLISLPLSLKSLFGVHTNIFSLNQKYSSYIFNHLNPKNNYSPLLAYFKGPNIRTYTKATQWRVLLPYDVRRP